MSLLEQMLEPILQTVYELITIIWLNYVLLLCKIVIKPGLNFHMQQQLSLPMAVQVKYN